MLLEKTNICPEVKLQRNKPVNLLPQDLHLFEKALSPTLKSVYLYHYKNVNVTPEGIVFNKFSLEKQFLIYPDHTKTYNPLHVLSNRVKRKKVKLPANQKYLLCFDYWSNAIFHWMCDALPRLQSVKELAKECVFLLPEHFQYSYIHETLKAFEVKSIYFFPVDVYLQCPNLYVPEQITTSGEMNPLNIGLLRETLLAYFVPKFSVALNFPRIYISRNKAKYRRVLNEEAVVSLLEKYDFKIIYFEDYTVTQQVEIAFNAKNMISLHGANLTNVIFMQPRCNVLELRKMNDAENNYYYSLADSVGCNYYFQNCEYRDTKPGNFFDLIVDVALLEEIVKKMINR